jgi:hypothetical protein
MGRSGSGGSGAVRTNSDCISDECCGTSSPFGAAHQPASAPGIGSGGLIGCLGRKATVRIIGDACPKPGAR